MGPRFAASASRAILPARISKTLYTKIATTMPRGAAASLGDAVYLDIVAHVLRENGFPAGSGELMAEGLSGVQVLPGRQKPPPPVGDFSYVEVVGCLAPGPENTWLLTNASEPAALALTGSALRQTTTINDKPLGTQTFRLLDAMAYNPDAHKGKKMYVKGLFIKLPGEQRMTISSLETIAPSCQLMERRYHVLLFLVRVRRAASRSAIERSCARQRYGRACTPTRRRPAA